MEEARLAAILRPAYQKRIESVNTLQGKFIYYTSAKAGLQIFKDRVIWMRAAACMNDYREIHYGIELFNNAFYHSPARKERLKNIALALGWKENILEDILLRLNGSEKSLVNRIFLTCISEHGTEAGDNWGRLSMWRAYGRTTGIAFVLNASALLRPLNQLPLMVSPVEYLSGTGFEHMLDEMLTNAELHIDELQREKSEMILQYFVDALFFSVFSIKHPGFQEEKEWRIIYREEQGRLAHELVSIDGIPQIVYKIPLKMRAEDRQGIIFEELLDHLIIGPTGYADVIADAFTKALEELNFSHAQQRVYKSNIPLR